MKIITLFFLGLVATTPSVSQDTSVVYLLKSTSGLIRIKINNQYSNWKLAGSKKAESLELALDKKNTIMFVSDIDSTNIEVDVNQYRKMSVVFQQDTFSLLIHGYKYVKPASFSRKYIKQYKQKVVVLIPEVQELVQIIIALTQQSTMNPNLIEKNTSYYKEVINRFNKFKNHKAVLLVDSLLQENQYHNIKMNSCVFKFNNKKITEGGVYDRISFGRQQNIIRPHIDVLADFALQSGFRDFYREHEAYYRFLIAEQLRIVNIKKMWAWLESKFEDRYDCYKITFSPLVFGNHSTQRFEDNGFKETIMFIGPPDSNVGWRKNVSGDKIGFEGELARIVFTEIDHNYVNPVSDQYKLVIDSAFRTPSNWGSAQAWASYRSAYSVFNEYMTWSVFSLYVYDNYGAEDFIVVNENMVRLMNDERGFVRFREFNKKLVEMNKSKPGISIFELYERILSWCISASN
jgi:hypothetical protein